MTDLRTAAQQALEALEKCSAQLTRLGYSANHADQVIPVLRAALEQPEQEPAAWIEHGLVEAPDGLVWEKGSFGYYTPLYTHPPRREWQGLTDEEIMDMTRTECADMRWPSTALNIARAIEAALKEKNMKRDNIIRMAHKAGLFDDDQEPLPEHLERFAALVAAAERERLKWDSIHSCGNDCQRPACVQTRKAVEAERESCLQQIGILVEAERERILAILDELQANCEHHTFYGYAANVIREESPK